MRYVFVIGNGFDLAHGAPTKFTDFSLWLKNEVFIPEIINKYNNYGSSELINHSIANFFHTKNKFISGSFSYKIDALLNNQIQQVDIKEVLLDNFYELNNFIKNKLIRVLFEEENEYWFDIEETFFRILKEYKDDILYPKNLKGRMRPNRFEDVKRLNHEFEYLKKQLITYLQSISIKRDDIIYQFLEDFEEKFKSNGKQYVSIINFNYTDTFKDYPIFQNSNQFEVDYYPIHGTLNTDIVFGYGNDKDKDYQEIKDLNNNDFLRYFKTQKYLKKKHYRNIYNSVVNSPDNYEVFILGHSLGLTDKTLLNEIFNSPKCQRIHLYKRSDLRDPSIRHDEHQIKVDQEFEKLTMAATRIIDDQRARTLITSYDIAKYFP